MARLAEVVADEVYDGGMLGCLFRAIEELSEGVGIVSAGGAFHGKGAHAPVGRDGDERFGRETYELTSVGCVHQEAEGGARGVEDVDERAVEGYRYGCREVGEEGVASAEMSHDDVELSAVAVVGWWGEREGWGGCVSLRCRVGEVGDVE